MSRTLWFVAGAASGTYALIRARRLAGHLTPDGLAARAAALSVGLRMFVEDVNAGMVEREGELWTRLQGAAAERPELPGRPAAEPTVEIDAGRVNSGHR